MMKFLNITILCLSIISLTSCTTTDEVLQEYRLDPVIGGNFTPKIHVQDSQLIGKILSLPVVGPSPEDTKQAFTYGFIQDFSKQSNIPITIWPKKSVGGNALDVNRSEAIQTANLIGADALLFVDVHHTRLTPPQLIQITLRLENIHSKQIIASAEIFYDANQITVVNSARRYYKKNISIKSPFGSEQIISSRYLFAQFVGSDTGIQLAKALKR